MAVIHVLADGRVVDSIEGYVVPTTGPTAIVYDIVADLLKEQSRKKKEDKPCECVKH